MIHTFFTEEQYKKAAIKYLSEVCGVFDDKNYWTKQKIEEQWREYIDDEREVYAYAEKNNFCIKIDDEKDLKEQLKDINITQIEFMKLLLKEINVLNSCIELINESHNEDIEELKRYRKKYGRFID